MCIFIGYRFSLGGAIWPSGRGVYPPWVMEASPWVMEESPLSEIFTSPSLKKSPQPKNGGICLHPPMARRPCLAVEPTSRNPEGRGSIPRLGSRRSSLISIEHAELLSCTSSLVGAVLCLASNHGIACALRLGPTQPVTNFWG